MLSRLISLVSRVPDLGRALTLDDWAKLLEELRCGYEGTQAARREGERELLLAILPSVALNIAIIRPQRTAIFATIYDISARGIMPR